MSVPVKKKTKRFKFGNAKKIVLVMQQLKDFSKVTAWWPADLSQKRHAML